MKIADRVGAFTGAAYVLLTLVGNTLSTDNYPGPSDAHPTGRQDIDYVHWLAGTSSAQFGVTMELMGFAAFVLFVGYLCTRVHRAGWLAAAAAVGGAVAVAVKVASGAPIVVGYLLRDEMSDEMARVLADLNGAAFVLDWLPTGLFVACAGGAALVSGTIGRILGWGGVAVGTASVVSAAVTGVHVLSANVVPFLLCLLWILAISVRLGVRRTFEPSAERTPQPASLGT